MRTIWMAVTALALVGCADGSDEAEVETASVVSAVLSVSGPGGEDQEFVVEITHDDEAVSREEARRLVGNIQLQRRSANGVAVRDGAVPAEDGHWSLEGGHGFHVTVTPVLKGDVSDRFDHLAWGWVEEALAVLHCPPGH